jgi:hypothetical protein
MKGVENPSTAEIVVAAASSAFFMDPPRGRSQRGICVGKTRL